MGWLAGWAGWLGLQRVPNSVPEVSAPFGRGPRAVGPQPTNICIWRMQRFWKNTAPAFKKKIKTYI